MQAGVVTNSTGEIGFTAAAWTGNQQVLCFVEPVGLCQLRDLALLDIAPMLVVDV